ATTSVEATSPRAAVYAARAIADFAVLAAGRKRTLLPLTIADAPAFKLRGVIEGFYGPPYADADRATLLQVMGELRQNTFVYAPQNDDFAAANWFALYDDASAQPLEHAVAVAAGEGIDFVYGIRPGQGRFYPSTQPIRYSSDDDFATLTAKLDQVRGWGVTQFGIFFDDEVPDLLDDTDLATFGSLAEAQAFLLNRVDDYLRAVEPSAQLYTIGTHYSSADSDWQSYSQALSAALHPTVPVMWTGQATYSTTISAADLAPVTAALGAPPIIWDNWPQKIDGLDGRSADVATATRGFLSNAVLSSWQKNPLEDFLEVLGTIGRYTWAPATYDPTLAWNLWNSD
ncbi:MAG TPA: beta-N-acetylglucosaminidase domain-containing protein, partial [Polyangia bacterium]